MKSKITILILAIIIFLLGFILRIGNYELSSPDKNLYYDDNGLQYFQESDSYYNYRLTRNLLEHGNLGDKIINGKPWDLHSYYPPGVPVDYPPLLPYITVGFYYILNFINSMNLREVCLWLPTALGPLAGVIGFLFSRRLNGEFGGFITGMLIVTAPLYVYKTNFGFFDTDMLNITLPLLIIWLIFEAENAKIKRDRMILAGCSGFFLFLFSLAWNGWIYYFYIIIIALIYNFIKRRDLTLFLSFISVSICLIGIFNIFSLYNALMAPYTQLGYLLRGENIWYPWPDPYKNVAELQKPNIETFIVIVSPLTFVFGLIGLFTIYKRAKSLIGLIIILWTVSALFSTLKGARFIILLIPPLSILAGIFWHEFKNTLKDKLNNIHKNKILHILQLGILFVIFFQFFLLLSVTSNFKPGYDDYFMEAAQWINNNTPEDTVIITDWSYGHFFASESNRPVAFDGRLAYIETLPIRGYWYDHNLDPEVPTTARDYWINLALTTDNPSLAENIFKMLATNGDQAYLLLNNYTHNKTRSYTILQNILAVDKKTAHKILKENGLSDEKSKKVLEYTHPKTTRPLIIIIVDEMATTIKSPATNRSIAYQSDGEKVYSIITNGTEEIGNVKSNFSIIIGNKTLIVDKNYRNSLLIKFLLGENIGDFIKIFENEKIKIYKIKGRS